MTNTLEALVKLYEEIGFEEPNVIKDINVNYLSECTARNKRTVLWYLDEAKNIAIYTDTEEFLSEEEIEDQLC